MVRRPPPHGISVWARDLRQTRWAWSCRCGARWATTLGTAPHPDDLPSREAASNAGRAHINTTRAAVLTPIAPEASATERAHRATAVAPRRETTACIARDCWAPTDHHTGLCDRCRKDPR